MIDSMNYEAVLVYNDEGEFLGFAIKEDSARKLQSTILYLESEHPELRERIEQLNLRGRLQAAWPTPADADVQALLQDEEFHPIEYHQVQVIDEGNSYYAWREDGTIDEDASVIRYTLEEEPVRPSDAMMRVQKACEEIARRRSYA